MGQDLKKKKLEKNIWKYQNVSSLSVFKDIIKKQKHQETTNWQPKATGNKHEHKKKVIYMIFLSGSLLI